MSTLLAEALFAYLKDVSGLNALVGTRIYPLVLPQNPVLPAITYTRVSNPKQRLLARGAADTFRPRIQFDCWAITYKSAQLVASQLQAALQDYAGIMGGVVVLDADVDTGQDAQDPDSREPHVQVDVIMMHQGGN